LIGDRFVLLVTHARLWFTLAPFSGWRPAFARRAGAAPRDLEERARSRAFH